MPRPERPPKRRVNLLKQEGVTTVDWKDATLLRKFISDRGKVRSRRVTGLTPQQQREVAAAVKNAREMALLPYPSKNR
jgi:small subunit ribosomal protein S18